MQIAVVNRSSLEDLHVALMVEACNAQIIEAAAAWGIPPTPVVFYATADGLPAENCRIMVIVDQLGVQGAKGFHSAELGVVFGRVENQGEVDTCVTLSHECLEMLVDPTCNHWRQLDSTRKVALEVCDPCQADTYAVRAEVAGIERDMWVANYVLPGWFDAASVGPFDRMRTIDHPLRLNKGGYIIVQENGEVSNVFLQTRPGDALGRANAAAKVAKPGSRTLQRLRG